MELYSAEQRAEFYSREFPKYPPVHANKGWLEGHWITGNNYKGSGYHGAYPPGYVKRIMALFPDAENILHLFSGSLPPGEYTRFDMRQPAEVNGDAHHLVDYFDPGQFDLILADPPYTDSDAQKYGTPSCNRNKVVSQAAEILQPGGYLVWMDQAWPMYRKDTLRFCGVITIVRSTNHRVRACFIWEKLP